MAKSSRCDRALKKVINLHVLSSMMQRRFKIGLVRFWSSKKIKVRFWSCQIFLNFKIHLTWRISLWYEKLNENQFLLWETRLHHLLKFFNLRNVMETLRIVMPLNKTQVVPVTVKLSLIITIIIVIIIITGRALSGAHTSTTRCLIHENISGPITFWNILKQQWRLQLVCVVCRCFSFLRRKKVDVLMLQEIHANLSSEDEWCRILKGFHFFSDAFEDAEVGLASKTPILSDF